MGKQTFDGIKKTVSVLLAVLFVVSLTASAGAACTDNTTTTTTPTTSDTDSKTLSTSDLGALIASILNNMGYKLDLSDSGSSFSFPSSLFNSLGTSGTTA